MVVEHRREGFPSINALGDEEVPNREPVQVLQLIDQVLKENGFRLKALPAWEAVLSWPRPKDDPSNNPLSLELKREEAKELAPNVAFLATRLKDGARYFIHSIADPDDPIGEEVGIWLLAAGTKISFVGLERGMISNVVYNRIGPYSGIWGGCTSKYPESDPILAAVAARIRTG